MMDIEQGRDVLIKAAEQDTPHSKYNQWAEDAKFWRGIVSGKGLEALIVSYKLRESEEQKDQRVRLTEPPTPEAANRTLAHFNRLQSTDKRSAKITYKKEGEAKAVLTERLNKFSGGRSLEDFLFETFTPQVATDPHSFLLVLFDGPKDDRGTFIEKPFPRPEIIPTEQIWNLKAENGVHEWLLRRVNHTGKVKGEMMLPATGQISNKEVTWAEYTLYFAGYTQTFTEITEANPVDGLDANQELIEVTNKDKKVVQWLLTTFQTQQTRPPFIQYGYERDPVDRDSFLSVMHPAKSEFKNLINRASEYALTLALHTFLQKYQYVDECKFTAPGQGKCSHGRMSATNEQCPKCKGSGRDIVATVQDVVTIKYPEDGERLMPLNNLIYYPTLPFEIVNHLKLEVDEKPDKIERAMWGILLGEKAEVAKTATEVAKKYDSVYNVLARAAQHWAEMYEHSVKLVAEYAEIADGLEVEYTFPADYEMETLDELLLALKNARDAGAGAAVEDYIRGRILKKQSKDNPSMVAWEEAQNNHRPFRTKSETDRAMVLSELPETDYSRILWTFFDEIFAEIRFEDPTFPARPFMGGTGSQKEIVKNKVAEFQGRLQVVDTAAPTRGAFDRVLQN